MWYLFVPRKDRWNKWTPYKICTTDAYHSISTAPEYQKLKALAAKNEDLLKETLSDEQKELLDKLTECITDISSISERDMFIVGFRLGMKLMIDVMKDE